MLFTIINNSSEEFKLYQYHDVFQSVNGITNLITLFSSNLCYKFYFENIMIHKHHESYNIPFWHI